MKPKKYGSNWSPRCSVCSALRKTDPQATQADRRARLLTMVVRVECQLYWLWGPPRESVTHASRSVWLCYGGMAWRSMSGPLPWSLWDPSPALLPQCHTLSILAPSCPPIMQFLPWGHQNHGLNPQKLSQVKPFL